MAEPTELDKYFDAYVKQITAAAKEYGERGVEPLLSEFQEKCYMAGRHMLIDNMRRELDRHDDRIGFGSKG